jgi:hypothetical protein
MFWRPFARRGQLRVICGGHRFDDWETSGLAGIGDVKAVEALQDIFFQNGLGPLKVTYSLNPDRTLIEGKDLILIGSPDVNWVTSKMTSERPGRFRFEDAESHIVSITDHDTGCVYPDLRVGDAGDQDAGVIKMMPNPFYPDNNLLIIAGSFGPGTLAGVELTRKKEFLRHKDISNNQSFECLFSVRVVAGEPLPAKIIEVQPFP